MKKKSNTTIMTDTTDPAVIVSRFNDEYNKAIYWLKKIGQHQDNVIPIRSTGDRTLLFGDDRKLHLYEIEGIIPYTNPATGDTWAALVCHKADPLRTNLTLSLVYYFWNTIGSIGLMIMTRASIGDKLFRIIYVFTSHCMMRYRDRFATGLEGLELITNIDIKTNIFVPLKRPYKGKDGFELVCSDGVFRGGFANGVVKLRTFLPYDELGCKEREKKKEIFNNYVKAFS